jgi:hypothetical protein
VTRSYRRRAVAGALAAGAVLATGLLTACGTGQIAQTAQVQTSVPGVNAQADGRLVFIRDAVVDYGQPTGYPQGANAALSLWIFNDTEQPVTLVGVTAALSDGGAAEAVPVVLSSGAGSAAPCASRPPSSAPASSAAPSPAASSPAAPSPAAPSPAASSGTASPSASASPARGARASGSPSVSVPSSVPASPSPSPSAVGSPVVDVRVPAYGCVELSRRATRYVQAVGLPRPLRNEQSLAVRFDFTAGDGQRFAVGTPLLLPVSVPESPLPRPSASRP